MCFQTLSTEPYPSKCNCGIQEYLKSINLATVGEINLYLDIYNVRLS